MNNQQAQTELIDSIMEKIRGKNSDFIALSIGDDQPPSIASIAVKASKSIRRFGFFKVLIENYWDAIEANIDDIISEIVSLLEHEYYGCDVAFFYTKPLPVTTYEVENDQRVSFITLYITVEKSKSQTPE